MSTFPNIADYAFLSDCEVSTLIAPDGSVEWLCLPRPDAPSVFGALLDRSAGSFRFGPSNIDVPNQRRYIPGTNILETTWHTPTGWLIVTDALVIGPAPTEERREEYRRAPGDTIAQGTLLRIATCCSGRVDVQTSCLPQFDYGQTSGAWEYEDGGYERVTTSCGDVSITLEGSLRLGTIGARTYGRTTLEHGQTAWLALSWGGHGPKTEEEAREQLADTETFWRDWLSIATFDDHPWRPYVERSALALKALSYAPTGAIMAAGTTSLPESPGGERNWDYRYTWIHDTAFMLRALHDLGFDWEAFEYFAFLIDAITASSSTDWDLQIMYGIGGETDLTEHLLDHLSGYRNSRPVRIGNGAYDQHQHDVWGMILDAVAVHARRGGQIAAPVWAGLSAFVEKAIERYTEPDQGIWEMRGDPQHFVASKVMCWVAVDRGIKLARIRDDDAHVEKWQAAADAIKAEVLEKGVDDRGSFTQFYGSKDLDASLLLIALMGFLPPTTNG